MSYKRFFKKCEEFCICGVIGNAGAIDMDGALDNNTTAYIQEYAVMSNPNLIVTFTADVNSSNVRLIATKESGISGSVTYKFTKMILD